MKAQTTNTSAPFNKTDGSRLLTMLKRIFGSDRMISAASLAGALILWTVITQLQIVSPLFLPSPQAVWSAFLEIIAEGYKGNTLLMHIWDSMQRLLWAFILAIVTAVPLGMVSGYSKKVRAALDPFIEFYRPLPPLAYYTLLVIWFGIGNESKIILLYLAAFAPLYISAVAGVQRVPLDRINGALSLGASKVKIFTHIIFPSCLPELFTGLRTAIGFTYATLVAAEMIAAASGIGWMVLDASKFLRSDVIFVGIFIMSGLAMLLDWAVRYLEIRLIPWKGKE